jgi:hypothetical protein
MNFNSGIMKCLSLIYIEFKFPSLGQGETLNFLIKLFNFNSGLNIIQGGIKDINHTKLSTDFHV